MANYNLIVDSTFQPFSFERYLQPYQMYGEEYRAQEEALSELSTKADIWEGMANEQTDPYAYKMYKSYSNDLNRQAEQLAREGLTPGSRQNILKMKQRYSSDILPIEQAYTRRNQLAEEQRQALLKDPTLMFERMASQMSLDDFIRNPEINYGSSYSGNLLKSAVGEAAANLTKQMRENPRVWRSILDDQYYETVMQRGFTSDDIYRAIQDPEAFPELTKIVNDAITSSGIMSWADDATIRKALGHARQGLWNAVGETDYEIQSNKGYTPIPNPGVDNNDPSKLYYRLVPRTSVADMDYSTTEMNNDLKFIQEIINDPSLINKKSSRTIPNTKYIAGDPQSSFNVGVTTGSKEEEYYPNQEKLNSIKRKYNIDLDATDINSLSDLAQQISYDIDSSAVRSFLYKPNITQSDLITQVLKENSRTYNSTSGTTGLYELNDDGQGKPVDISEINNYFTSDSDFHFDPDLGFVINSTNSNGETKSALIDPELFDDPMRTFSNTQQSIKEALKYGEYELANTLIDALMAAFYHKFNTLERRQSNTTSN